MNPISILRHVHPRMSGMMAFKKGGGAAPTSQSVTQSNIPEYAAPYFERLLERAESVYGKDVPYQAYTGQRQADLPGDISAAYDVTRQVAGQGIAGLPQAMDVTAGNIQAGQEIAQRAGVQFQFGGTQFEQQAVQPFAGFQEAQAREFEFDPTQRFTGAAVQEYMSPYMQAVVDEQSRRAIQQLQEQRGARGAQAVGAGAFGGSRQAIQESLAERDLMDRLAGIQAEGSQQAFQQAAQMFGQDRAAEFARQQAQAGELARTQGIGTQEAARVQAAQAAELARAQGIDVAEAGRVQAAQAAEQARIQAAQAAENRAAQQQQLQALGFTSEQAQQMVGFGEAGRAADIQSAQLLENIGRSQLAREQEARDIAYQDFVAQRAYPEQQLQGISSILRGVPVQPGTTTTAYAPYNPLQQALGAGLGAIGLYRGLTG